MTDHIILKGIVGSTAYGLAVEGSDKDYIGCYISPSILYLGLDPPPWRHASVVTKDPDIQMHEIGKLLHLLLDCNPTVMELLWLDSYEVQTPMGASLVDMRDRFMSAHKVKACYLGYAKDQFRRLNERGGTFSSDLRKRTEKHARHLLRLLVQGYGLYASGELILKLDDPQRYFEFGKLVAENPEHAAQTIAQYEKMFEETTSCLPEHVDRHYLDTWLMLKRLEGLTQGLHLL